MKIERLGRVELPPLVAWQAGGVITPTPYALDEKTIRVFTGFRDKEGVSRIGFIDLDSRNPMVVKQISREPSLNIGRDGCFDDNGMIIGDIKEINGKLYMFYIGFQIVKKAKFLAFTGLAISEDQGVSFVRVSESPILDRSGNASTIKAVHSINMINDEVVIYYAVGDDWEYISGNPYPKYEIYCSRFDVRALSMKEQIKCITVSLPEYRIGKPTVYETECGYMMFYTRGKSNDLSYYKPGIAISSDGFNWERNDELYPDFKADNTWDGVNTAYPRIVENHLGDQFLFYSGNGMGAAGFGVGRIIEGRVKFSQCIECSE